VADKRPGFLKYVPAVVIFKINISRTAKKANAEDVHLRN